MKKYLCFLFCLLIALSCASCDYVPAEKPSHNVYAVYVNVGKADACVVKIDGYTAVIDTGTADRAPVLIGVLNALGVTEIDALFLTHTHHDHIGGASALCEALPVKTLYRASITEDETVFRDLAETYSIREVILNRNDTVRPFDDAVFSVLAPITKNKDDNDNSLVLRLAVNGLKWLFTGDMQFDEERTLLTTSTSLSADILKVGNHGNPDATSALFGAKVHPSLAVISTDTTEDTDSADDGVIKNLLSAETVLTEEYELGVSVVSDRYGNFRTEAFEAPGSDVVASVSADRSAQTVTVSSDGDLTGFYLATKKNEYVLRLDGSDRIIPLPEKTLKKNDTVTLYDVYGHVVSRFELSD